MAGLVTGLAVGLAGAVITPTDTAVAASESDLAQELLDRHAPELVFQEQPTACGEGEPFRPIDPAEIFDRADVVLRGPAGEAIERPTLDELPSPGEGWYLDLPGNALEPKCAYERFHDSLGAPSVVLGRIATDPDHPDRLVLQYWFFYVFNDWNDRHEGDWEMIQVELPASSVEEAFDVQPVRTGYAQHEGTELSEWQDGAVQIVDETHPTVFVGVGSHASYYSSERWFGASAQSGFGCDETLGPSIRERPPVVRIDTDSPPPWVSYVGRWGEKQPSFNNGPTGPITKTQWEHPVTWMDEEGRVGATSLPAGGSAVTDFFCEAARLGSVLLFRAIDSPGLVLLMAVVVVTALVLLARSTRWRPADLEPVMQRRAGGQIIRSSLLLVRRHRRTFLPLGSLLIVAGAVAGALHMVLVETSELGDIVAVLERRSLGSSALSAVISLVVVLPTTAVVGVATQLGVRAVDRGEPATVRRLLRDVWGRPRAVVTQVVTTSLLVLGFLSVVLAPLALWLWARWAVVVPAAIDSRRPFELSARLTSGRRLRALALSGVTLVLVGLVPPLVGTVVLLLTGWSFLVVNVIAATLAMVLVPAGAVVVALQYGDLVVRSGPVEATPVS